MAKEKVVKHPTTEDLVNLKSPYSSMRWAFIFMVKLGAVLSAVSIIGMLILSYFGKTLPEAGIAAVLGVVFTTAFGGKALQAGRESTDSGVDDSTNAEPSSDAAGH